jgi:hypothetical protein
MFVTIMVDFSEFFAPFVLLALLCLEEEDRHFDMSTEQFSIQLVWSNIDENQLSDHRDYVVHSHLTLTI